MSFVARSSRPALRYLRSSSQRTSSLLTQTRSHSWGYSTCRNLPPSQSTNSAAWGAFGLAATGALGYTAWKNDDEDSSTSPSAGLLPTIQCDALHPTIQCDALPMREKMEHMIKTQQDHIVRALEKVDGSTFRRDSWERPDHGGGGISCVLQDGNVFEKAGVNVSVVQGMLPPAAVRQMRVNHKAIGDGSKPVGFFAAGLSMVLHPKNPMAPTVHLNYRYFETVDDKGEKSCWWFGGGTDLTPSYLFPEDAVHFHQVIKDECDKHDKTYYKKFKKWCDEYFWVKHRNEARGIGGIFFDDLDDKDPEELFAFAEGCLKAFLPSYLPIVEKRKNMPYTLHNKEWQQLRRGRYVEFNLVHDRGTAFGLNTPSARVESILMSLPLTAAWKYMHEPTKGSPEEQLVEVLQKPKDWIPLE